ncbi:MAG: hypothetical protein ABH851_09610 [Methanobacteriota archaeon]
MASTRELTPGKRMLLKRLEDDGIKPAALPDISEGGEPHTPPGTRANASVGEAIQATAA